jgi:hypothetical protein
MPIVFDAKDLAPEPAEDLALPLEPSFASECYCRLESGVTEWARIRPKADISDDARDNTRRRQSAQRHNAQDAAVTISEKLMERCKRVRRDRRL